MILVGAVKMPVVQIIDMAFVFDRRMAASGAVGMTVPIVRFVSAHFGCLLPITSFFWARMGRTDRDVRSIVPQAAFEA